MQVLKTIYMNFICNNIILCVCSHLYSYMAVNSFLCVTQMHMHIPSVTEYVDGSYVAPTFSKWSNWIKGGDSTTCSYIL